MRAIDADALLDSLRDTHDCLIGVYNKSQGTEKRISSAQVATFLEAIMRVKEAPTIDAALVVRCADCINYRPSPFGHPSIGWCMICGRHRKPGYYCADGERAVKP